jgi:DNA-binding IclR family transcriptional regulator
MTDEVKQPEAEAQKQMAAQTEQPSTDLTISDLNALKTVIDVATQRGAFKAAEMEAVGKVYNKLNNFLATVAPAKEGQ